MTTRQALQDVGGAVVLSLIHSLVLGALVTVGCGLVAYFSAHQHAGLKGVVLVVVLSLPITAVVAVKRALLMALYRGARRAKLGERTVQSIFARLPQGAAQAAQKLPLQQAEERLRTAVAAVLGEEDSAGFLTGRLHRLLVERIEALTLSRLRQEGQDGVDLVRVRDDLAARADDALCDSLQGARLKLTVLYVGLTLLMALLVSRGLVALLG